MPALSYPSQLARICTYPARACSKHSRTSGKNSGNQQVSHTPNLSPHKWLLGTDKRSGNPGNDSGNKIGNNLSRTFLSQYQPNPERLCPHPVQSESRNRNRGKNGNISGNIGKAASPVTHIHPTRRPRHIPKLSLLVPSTDPRHYLRHYPGTIPATFRQRSGNVPAKTARAFAPPPHHHSASRGHTHQRFAHRQRFRQKIGNHLAAILAARSIPSEGRGRVAGRTGG